MEPITVFGIGAAIWLAAVFAVPDVRTAMLNGLRCMGRYPDLWRIPALFGVLYAVFQLVATGLFLVRMQDDWREFFSLEPIAELPGPVVLATSAVLPALESASGIFNSFSLTFPLSGLLALAFVFNVRRASVEFAQAVSRRLPRAGWIVVLAVFLCALCAIAKPLVYLFLPEFVALVPAGYGLLAGTLINVGSFFFEFLLGVCVQIYLMLMAYAWVRGITFDRSRLFGFAERRLGVLMKWELVLMGLIFLLVSGPLLVEVLSLYGDEGSRIAGAAFANVVGRPAVAAIMVIFCAVPITLVFHNESLRAAIGDNARFVVANLSSIIAFLVAVFLAFAALAVVRVGVGFAFGGDGVIAHSWRVIHVVVQALFAGWFVAAWVCLYKQSATRQKEIIF